VETLTSSVSFNPKDAQYRKKRQRLIYNEYLPMSTNQLRDALLYQASQPRPENVGDVTKEVIGGILDTGIGEQLTRKSILDSTGGGTSGGSVLVRQDLEPLIYA